MFAVFHEAEEHAIRFDNLATVDQGEPVVESFPDRAVLVQRGLIGPVNHRHGRIGDGTAFEPGQVVPGCFADLLIPDVKTRRHVPDGLRHWQHGELAGQEAGKVDGRAGRKQAVIVVNEVRIAAVDAFVVRNVGVGSVDADALGNDFRQGPPGAEQVVIGFAGADLVAGEDTLFELAEQRCGIG
ncbi:MAG: hypothetical protein JO122_11945 [Acetobacteraceae bacterium]|nr:hypothetical protein [Acetobacteraceae bacterium]